MRTYKQALEFLDTFQNFEQIGLERLKGRSNLGNVRKALKILGDPHEEYKTLHVAGTKGKGSVSVFASNILQQHSYKVGLYVSPHLSDIRERISVDGNIISEEDFVQVIEQIISTGESVFTPQDLSYFEMLTLIALVYFKEKQVDFAVLECGLGGRLDATNVVDPEVTAITVIGMDHMDVLGEKITDIANEKAGIMKEGKECVVAPQEMDVMAVLKNVATLKKVPLNIVGEHIKVRVLSNDQNGTGFELNTPNYHYGICRSSMIGDFQAENAAVAVGMCERVIRRSGNNIDENSVRKGIEVAFAPGRFEVIANEPLIVIDAAHNAYAIRKMKYSVEQIFNYDRLILILGVSRDKDIRSICSVLKGFADLTICTSAENERSADPSVIRGFFKGENAIITREVKEALGRAFTACGKRDLILATGSFYVIGEVRKLVRP